MDKKYLTIIIALILVSTVVAGSAMFLFPYEPGRPPKANETSSTEQGIQEIVNSNNKFGFDLYSELDKGEQDNIFYSPHSIYSALAMTYEGARGQTKDEMKSVFHFPKKLRPNFAAVYNDINEGSDKYELRTGNALWVQENYSLLDNYTNTVEKYYGGKAANLDFVEKTEESRQTINNFIEEQTNNKIKDLIPKGSLNPLTRLVLTNAIYFKGTWEWKFDKKETRDMDFKITPDNVVKTPIMHMEPDKAKFNYSDLEDLQILELPYKGGEVSMLILLPKEDLDSIEPLTSKKLEEWKGEIKETNLEDIYMPKFEFNTKYFMVDTLSDMGMSTAFSERADFSGIDGTKSLFIQDVIHQAYVKVDEKGTEAAAATAVVGTTGVRPSKVFRADHPFIFLIQERDTGNILFLGKVVDPR